MRKRNENIDFLKGVAIILVVFAHFIQFGSGNNFLSENYYFENVIFKIIYSFHMPLFMIISGYLFYYSVKKNNFKKNIINRMKNNLLPIIVWSIIPIIINLLSLDSYNLYNIVKVIVAGIVYNLWFLWAVLLCSLIVLLCNKFFDDSIIVYVVMFAISLFIPNILNFDLYVFMFPYFVFGYLYNKYNKDVKTDIKYIFLFTILFVILLTQYNYDSFIYNSGTCILNNFWKQLGIDLYRYSVGFCGSIFVILLVLKLIKKIPIKIRNIITMIGKNSLIIYIVTDYLYAYIIPRVTYSLDGVNYLLCAFCTLILVAISIIISKILNKNRITNMLFLGNRVH